MKMMFEVNFSVEKLLLDADTNMNDQLKYFEKPPRFVYGDFKGRFLNRIVSRILFSKHNFVHYYSSSEYIIVFVKKIKFR